MFFFSAHGFALDFSAKGLSLPSSFEYSFRLPVFEMAVLTINLNCESQLFYLMELVFYLLCI